MRTVLGIDAAWTAAQASGVALVTETDAGWQLKAVTASYRRFHALSEGEEGEQRPSGGQPDAQALLTSAAALCGRCIDLVAVDMPLARSPICGRRASDNEVSREYGQRWASTHTPSVNRPGLISDRLRDGFEAAGYALQTSGDVTHGLIEVYPHPALIEFATAHQRLPYKYGKRSKYWPGELSLVRKANIWREMRSIATLMDNEIMGVERALPPLEWETASGSDWKAYEDMLDAVICAAVGICVLEGRAVPFGDASSAIWIPKPGSAKPARKQ